MLQNYSRYKLLQEFFDFPKKSFHMRELARNIRLAQISVINHLKALLKENLVIKEKGTIYNVFKANRENQVFKLLKQQDMVLRIHKSGVLDYIEKSAHPNCILLFGSASRGEDTEGSDIDLFVQAEEANLELTKYEKLINRKINILFEPDVKKLSKELTNNLINGRILSGYFKVM